MKKLIDSYAITKILLNEIFHSILSNSLFSKKRNRYILFLLLIGIYIAYYIFNISQYNQIFITEEQLTGDLENLLFSSLTNTIIIVAGIIYILVTVSFSLTEKMKYLLKILPFERHSILMGTILFKLLLSYGSFLIIFAIIIPLLKLFYFSFTLNIFILIYCQVVFFASTALYYFLFHTISSKLKLTKYHLNIIILAIFLFFYFFMFRFKIDEYMMGANFEVTIASVSLLIVGLVLLTGLLSYGIYYFKSNDDDLYLSNNFFLFKQVKHMNYFMLVFLGFIRNRLTLSLISIIAVICVISYIDTQDIFTSLETLLYIYPIVSLAAIRYFSTTAAYRKLNPLFGISVFQETITTTVTNILINLPLIISAFIVVVDETEMLYYGILLFESAIVVSIIFPKEDSSINEFSAYILCIILGTGLFLISNNVFLFGMVFLIVVMIKHYLLERSLTSEVI